MRLLFEDIIGQKAPQLTVACITADIVNEPTDETLWEEITLTSQRLKDTLAIESVNKCPAILSTRRAYKDFGKDPNRYRPSAEALTRRAVKGLDLYRSDSVVDLINLVSLETGHSIGAFDRDKIDGDTLTLGVGRANEPYEAIGRGALNIEGLPVWRDSTGGVGTPTSDNERTKLSHTTRRLVVTVNCYGDSPSALDTSQRIEKLLVQYANATNIDVKIYRP